MSNFTFNAILLYTVLGWMVVQSTRQSALPVLFDAFGTEATLALPNPSSHSSLSTLGTRACSPLRALKGPTFDKSRILCRADKYSRFNVFEIYREMFLGRKSVEPQEQGWVSPL
jgi:hypothetical protein